MSLWSKCYLVPLEDIRQRVNASPDVFDESQRRGTGSFWPASDSSFWDVVGPTRIFLHFVLDEWSEDVMGYLLASLTEQQVNNSSLNEIKGYFCHLKFRLIGPGRKGSSVA